MAEIANGSAKNCYPPSEFLSDLRGGIWGELTAESSEINLHRRNLQRAHIELLAWHAGRTDAASDLPALARGELKALLKGVKTAVAKAKDRVTVLHLEDMEARIDRILEPRLKS